MDLQERIKLTYETYKVLCLIDANGGNVPDGYVLECRDAWNSTWKQITWSPNFQAMFYRMTPTKPPRFTVSTDPCGVLDSETGMVALFGDGTTAFVSATSACDMLNGGDRTATFYNWSPLPKPQIPIGPEDVPPGSVFRQTDWPAWKYVPGYPQCSGKGLMMAGSYFAWESLVADWQILRHGSSEFAACSKDAP